MATLRFAKLQGTANDFVYVAAREGFPGDPAALAPRLCDGRQIPVDADGEVIERPLEVAGRAYRVTCVSMGNPHCVVFAEDVAALPLAEIGPRFEHHPFFPRRVNTEFVRATARDRLVMRVWERGAGETFACGTG